ncbi:MAG: MFS transporter [Gammaproteobacteria bacterium]|nr:MFS transporter [Gammaproteobacteria bacterium]
MSFLRSWSQQEQHAAQGLASIYVVRMMGLFMILPVFAVYAQGLPDATPLLTGLALGMYGLTNSLFSIPYGMLSDRFGRKRLIAIGLLVFALGSVVAAMSESIYGIILGRALQGAGAVASVLMALAADLSREENRLKMMSFIGISIGFAFAISMVLGPIVTRYVGMSGLFWFIALLAILALVILYTRVPDPALSFFHRDAQVNPTEVNKVLRDPQLLRLDFGVFTLHMVLMAVFVALPRMLETTGFLVDHHWQLYLPVFLLSVPLMVPFIILAENRRRMKQVFIGAIVGLAAALLALLIFGHTVWHVALALVIFFTAFNLLEASLPSLIAKMSPADRKGTAMGMFSTSQFMGAFAGGAMGGFSFQHWGATGVYWMCLLVIVVWLLLASTMKNPRYVSTYLLNIGKIDPADSAAMVARLVQVQGVAEATVEADEGIAYLKVDLHALDEGKLLQYSINEQIMKTPD